MERLTKRYDTHVAVICENCDKKLECNGGVICGEVLREHLATYEDTNLTPVDINDLRNELCLKCGKYKDAHLGACDGCRWRKDVD